LTTTNDQSRQLNFIKTTPRFGSLNPSPGAYRLEIYRKMQLYIVTI